MTPGPRGSIRHGETKESHKLSKSTNKQAELFPLTAVSTSSSSAVAAAPRWSRSISPVEVPAPRAAGWPYRWKYHVYNPHIPPFGAAAAASNVQSWPFILECGADTHKQTKGIQCSNNCVVTTYNYVSLLKEWLSICPAEYTVLNWIRAQNHCCRLQHLNLVRFDIRWKWTLK